MRRAGSGGHVRRFGSGALVATLALALGAAGLSGCGHEGDSLVLVGGEKVDSTRIDRDPLALLPSGVILASYLDAQQMFATSFGPDMAQIVQTLLPIGSEANFSPSRDVVRVFGGIYAMQGADFCAVVQGTFDVDRIKSAADARVVTASGAPLVKSHYAGNDVYTTGNVGFSLLTPHTILTGNETGIRRALDRLRDGRLERSIPQWMVDLMATNGAAFALAGDFTSQAAGAAVADKVPWLAGLRVVRVIGNFQPPGVNFAGTLSYADATSATNGAAALRNVQQLAQSVGWLASLGFGAAPPDLKVQQEQADLKLTMPLDAHYVSLLLGLGANVTRAVAATR